MGSADTLCARLFGVFDEFSKTVVSVMSPKTRFGHNGIEAPKLGRFENVTFCPLDDGERSQNRFFPAKPHRTALRSENTRGVPDLRSRKPERIRVARVRVRRVPSLGGRHRGARAFECTLSYVCTRQTRRRRTTCERRRVDGSFRAQLF